MRYQTRVTSKGTVTIAAPLRKEFNIRPGQILYFDTAPGKHIMLKTGTDMKAFEAKRAKLTKNIPNHLKGLAGDTLRQASATAWTTGYHD